MIRNINRLDSVDGSSHGSETATSCIAPEGSLLTIATPSTKTPLSKTPGLDRCDSSHEREAATVAAVASHHENRNGQTTDAREPVFLPPSRPAIGQGSSRQPSLVQALGGLVSRLR